LIRPPTRREPLGRARHFLTIAVWLAALSIFVAGQPAAAGDYQLGTMDKLHVRVAEWRTAEGNVRDWSSLTGDYMVGPAGTISLPFLGELPVAGKTTAEIAALIGDQLQQKFGLLDRPEASVELAEFRPFFIAGNIEKPGSYPYVPGLTVLKAVSLAGGLRRSEVGLRLARDFINARGNYEVLASERNGILARRARLMAEAEHRDEISFPKDLQQSEAGRKLMADETAFRAAREKRLAMQLSSIDDLKKLLQGEIESLDKKITTQNRQIDLSKQELASIGPLAEQGLVVKQRILAIEQQTADLEGKVLDMETAQLRAKQDISKATQNAITLQSDQDTQIAQDRQQAEADLQQVELKIAMYRDLMSEATNLDPAAALSPTGGPTAGMGSPVLTYSIERETAGKTSELAADETTEVLPGDVVKVGIGGAPAD
jgi:polysaccharide biosynthesis/export protein ExoF